MSGSAAPSQSHPPAARPRPLEQADGPRIGIFGCPFDSGNQGVSALGYSLIRGLLEAAPGAALTVFDEGAGHRTRRLSIGDQNADVGFIGCTYSRRYYRPSNLVQMHAAARLGLAAVHPMLRRIADFDMILSMSGGDSFSDIYGDWRFRAVTLPKLIALELGVPLVLPPQTYGPYERDSTRQIAGEIIRRADSVWARDAHSLAVARQTAGEGTDPSELHLGVDVAFGLPPAAPNDEALRESLSELRGRCDQVVGLNVSGLLYNKPGVDQSHYGMKSPYRETIHRLLDSLLARESLGIVLLPHVTAVSGDRIDCDHGAAETIRDTLSDEHRSRMIFAPSNLGPMEAKWIVSQTDWFCGTRMHSCIAGISLGIPTTAIAYSDKTLGVFETAGVQDCVVDPRLVDGATVVEQIMAGFDSRAEAAQSLRAGLPAVRQRLREQFEQIIGTLR